MTTKVMVACWISTSLIQQCEASNTINDQALTAYLGYSHCEAKSGIRIYRTLIPVKIPEAKKNRL